MPGPGFTVGPDVDEPIRIVDSLYKGWLLRAHYRIERVTGRPGVYVVRHFAAASDDDRARAVADVGSLDLDYGFRLWHKYDVVNRVRWSEDRRRWVEYVDMGTRVEDPLVQLELEMMIDLQSEVTL
ncbi:hypothetical protein AB0870_08105 [Microbacterium proteolyticum]|uniref:hypothetical protein n=1 Tax=Microbacterium proteolyticum TaxID=1572644 RepID=UPI002417163A|nr:hypothetical protein [Microbacterium proteolyticum]